MSGNTLIRIGRPSVALRVDHGLPRNFCQDFDCVDLENNGSVAVISASSVSANNSLIFHRIVMTIIVNTSLFVAVDSSAKAPQPDFWVLFFFPFMSS
jgi:hypothetical protein